MEGFQLITDAACVFAKHRGCNSDKAGSRVDQKMMNQISRPCLRKCLCDETFETMLAALY